MIEQRPFADVLHDILRNLQELVRAEVRLARAEVRQEAREAATAGAWVIAGAIVALTAWSFLLWAAAYGLGQVMPTWAAALLVALVTGVAAAVLLTLGVRRFARWRPVPERTIASLRENVAWIKQSTS